MSNANEQEKDITAYIDALNIPFHKRTELIALIKKYGNEQFDKGSILKKEEGKYKCLKNNNQIKKV